VHILSLIIITSQQVAFRFSLGSPTDNQSYSIDAFGFAYMSEQLAHIQQTSQSQVWCSN